jgi:PadR family transcriptional regulator PadR
MASDQPATINVKLGEFERLVLLVVQELDDNAYSITIQKAIEEVTAKPHSVLHIYVALWRLVGKGCLYDRLGSPTRVRGGRAKRLYRVTAEGSAALEQAEIEPLELGGITELAPRNIDSD